MKKFKPSLGFSLSLLLASAAAWMLSSYLGRGEEPRPVGEEVPAGLGVYAFELEVLQSSPGEAVQEVIRLEGRLSQEEESPGHFLSTWLSFDVARLQGRDAHKAFKSLRGKSVKSHFEAQSGELEHYLEGPDGQLAIVQASLLQKMIVAPELRSLDRRTLQWEQSGRDEIGAYRARYALASEAETLKLHKEWLRYLEPGISVEPDSQGFTYVYSQEGQLKAALGSLSISYATLVPTTYRSKLRVTLLENSRSLVALPKKSGGMQLRKFSLGAALHEPQRDFPELMTALAQLDAKSPSTEVYEIFSELKRQLKAEPQRAEAIAQKILQNQKRDEANRRQLGLMFGALAESESPETLRALSGLLASCPDSYCLVQTLVGISDHRLPDSAISSQLLSLLREKHEPEVRSTALLTLGSVAKNRGDAQSEIASYLLDSLEKPAQTELKTSVLAAMGNHGDPAYLKALEQSLVDQDPRVRAAAVYSLRSQPASEADAPLLGVVAKEKNKDVLLEAFKAITYRNLSGEAYLGLVRSASQMTDADLQLAAARSLVSAAQAQVLGARQALVEFQKLTPIAQVQAYIAGEAAAIAQ